LRCTAQCFGIIAQLFILVKPLFSVEP